MATNIPAVVLPSGERVPVLGQGTWGMGEKRTQRAEEVAALCLGIELGMTLIDTAEMYAEGEAEAVVSEAIAGRRSEVFLVSKVLPRHATRDGTVTACHASLKRLRTEQLDLYLLHWRQSVPLDETLDAFETLLQRGDIRYWGVSNFDTSDMEEMVALPGGAAVATDQVLYNLARRGIEFDLLPWSRAHRLPIMAYSPIDQGRLLEHASLRRVAARCNATPAQVALAWLTRQQGVLAIPKGGTRDHVRQNRAALEIQLSGEDLSALDRDFPPPRRKRSLEML